MSQKGLISALLSLALVLAVVVFMKMQGPDVSQYLSLKDPAIRTLAPQRVLVVEATGAPDKIGKKAFGLLMKTYFGIKGVPKGGPGFQAPRARWPLPAGVPKDKWIGRYAMPLPSSVKDVKLPKAPPGVSISVTTWEYGLVAEILHIGPYDKEGPAVQRLQDFIREKRYRIIGEHEEEYVRGPGMFFSGDPKTYCTVIRYRVAPQGDSTALAFAE